MLVAFGNCESSLSELQERTFQGTDCGTQDASDANHLEVGGQGTWFDKTHSLGFGNLEASEAATG